ncbi:hypothetical protein F5Y17DRAFT_478481 [Xylariaceae sp. FL0594]|nr:hypothetical protein F5Y17DRAFT_478481 [Xylariaceae sp. FL0594]
MASEQGPVATEAPPPFASTAPQATSGGNASVEAIAAEAARATQQALSLKRQREVTPTSPSSVLPVTYGSDPSMSPSKAARLAGASSRHSPPPMTGAAALEDERQREEEQYRFQVSGESDNPAYRAQTALMSASALAMSRPPEGPEDGPHQHGQSADPATQASETGHAEATAEGEAGHTTGTAQTGESEVAAPSTQAQLELPPSGPAPAPNMHEPDSKVDLSSEESVANLARLAGSHMTTNTSPMNIDTGDNATAFNTQPAVSMEDKAVQSLSYPGILPPPTEMPAPPARGMSMPMTGTTPSAPRSPGSKKHKCPYCETEFTRHHNLKSHLLTHSQEKPFVCSTCTMRFRRLHDLKRHTKLHTGEKPHICPKCDRKFARGDALARHSKGPGGCVGRRSSMGSYLGEEDPEGVGRLENDDTSMSGVMYDNAMNDPGMSEDDKRRLSSVPSIKAQHIEGIPTIFNFHSNFHSRSSLISSWLGGNQGQPFHQEPERGSTTSASHAPGTSIASMGAGAPNLSMFGQVGMTESPKPLSPGLQAQDPASAARQRSPSLTSHFQQQQSGRSQTDRRMSPVPGYGTADAARYAVSVMGEQATAQREGTEHSAQQQQVLSNSGTGQTNQTSAPSGNIQNGGSGDSTNNNNLFTTDQGVWTYIHTLDEALRILSDRVHSLESKERAQEEKITYLTTEVATLRAQIDLSHAANNGTAFICQCLGKLVSTGSTLKLLAVLPCFIVFIKRYGLNFMRRFGVLV